MLKGIGPKRQSYFYSVVLKFFLYYSYLSDNTLRPSIFCSGVFVFAESICDHFEQILSN